MNRENLKPFSLQAALAGEPVMLRIGQKAFVRHYETEARVNEYHQIWGVRIRKDESTMVMTWSKGGGCDESGRDNCYDIIGMWPKTRIINGFEVPVPETESLKVGDWYFVPKILCDEFCEGERWSGSGCDERALNRGLVFLTKKDAIANAKAMLGIKPLRGGMKLSAWVCEKLDDSLP